MVNGTTKDLKDKTWKTFLPSVLGEEFEPNLAKNSSDGWRISLEDNLTLVSCNSCSKLLLESALINHAKSCKGPIPQEKIDIIPPSNTAGPSTTAAAHRASAHSSPVLPKNTVTASVESVPPIPTVPNPKKAPKKRKLDGTKSKDPNATKKVKANPVFNFDTMCGVKTDTGPCVRAITCKMHSISLKRAVLGRSNTFDALFADYQAKALAKKGVAAPIPEKIEAVVSEAEVLKLIDSISTSKPKPINLNSHFSLVSLIQKRKRQLMHDLFSKV